MTVSSSDWTERRETGTKDIAFIGLNLNMRGSRRPIAGTDLTPVSEKDIPIIGFFTGFHDDYHQISDEIYKINLEKNKSDIHVKNFTEMESINRTRQENF